MVGAGGGAVSLEALGPALTFIRENPQIRDVIVSGGDPLAMGTEKLVRLVAAVRAKPGGYNFASPGSGTVHHLLMEMLKSQENLNVLHVPYQGSGQAVTDMMIGRIDFMLLDAPVGMPHVRPGKTTPRAVPRAHPSASAATAPRAACAGYALNHRDASPAPAIAEQKINSSPAPGMYGNSRYFEYTALPTM